MHPETQLLTVLALQQSTHDSLQKAFTQFKKELMHLKKELMHFNEELMHFNRVFNMHFNEALSGQFNIYRRPDRVLSGSVPTPKITTKIKKQSRE